MFKINTILRLALLCCLMMGCVVNENPEGYFDDENQIDSSLSLKLQDSTYNSLPVQIKLDTVDQFPWITFLKNPAVADLSFILERRFDNTFLIDTILLESDQLILLDSSIISEGNWIYYRLRELDSDYEPLWDSLWIENQSINITPFISVEQKDDKALLSFDKIFLQELSIQYKIFRVDETGEQLVLFRNDFELDGFTTFWEDGPLDPGTYFYRLEIEDSFGRVSSSTLNEIEIPGKKEELVTPLLSLNSSSWSLEGTPFYFSDRYFLERALRATGPWILVDTLILDSGQSYEAISFEDTPPYSGTWFYRYQFDKDNYTLYSPVVSAEFVTENFPGKKIGVQPLLVRIEQNGNKVVGVSELRDSTNYFLLRSPASDTNHKIIVDSARWNDKIFNLQDIPSAGDYLYTIQGENLAGDEIKYKSAAILVHFIPPKLQLFITSISQIQDYINLSVVIDSGFNSFSFQRTDDTTSTHIVRPLLTFENSYWKDAHNNPGNWFYRLEGIMNSDTIISEWVSLSVLESTINPVIQYSQEIQNLGTYVSAIMKMNSDSTYYLFRSNLNDSSGSNLVDSVYNYKGDSTLNDAPKMVGEYFYWTEKKNSTWSIGESYLRSTKVSVSFSNKSLGPIIKLITTDSNQIKIEIEEKLNSIAYSLERTSDTTKPTLRIDTISVNGIPPGTFFDTPDTSGHWFYRALWFDFDLKISQPGPWSQTYAPWVSLKKYFPLPGLYAVHRGTSVHFPVSITSGDKFKLQRSQDASFQIFSVVDSLNFDSGMLELKDIPNNGYYYYRIEKQNQNEPNTTYQSEIFPLDIDGTLKAPDILSTTTSSSGIQLKFHTTLSQDTLEVWRGQGEPKVYSKIGEVTGPVNRFLDSDDIPTGFYYYYLILRTESLISNPGIPYPVYHEK